MKVLLVSPLDPPKPSNLKFLMGGENTYTRTLLQYPPKNVEYVHHAEALAKGLIEYLPLQRKLEKLVKFRILPLSSGSQCLRLKIKFDLIHCHTYSIKTEGPKVPIVISDSSSNWLFLKDYLGWPIWRIRAGYSLRRFLFTNLEVIDPDTNMELARNLIVFSRFAQKIHLQLGLDEQKTIVLPPGLPQPTRRNFSKSKKIINILFVGIWFERKGGLLLLQAFELLSKKYANLKLTIVGSIPKRISIKNSSISQFDYVKREKLLSDFFPKADIFVLVPPIAEGFGFAVLEAMSFGIPTVVSNVYALSEIVEDGRTGFLIDPGSLDQLVEKLEILIKDNKLRQNMGQAAKNRFDEKFSIKTMQENLLKVYREAIAFN